jgi:hypothetical protein
MKPHRFAFARVDLLAICLIGALLGGLVLPRLVQAQAAVGRV